MRAPSGAVPAAINVDAVTGCETLKAGAASEAKLNLKGDLAKFPFLDRKQGRFLVTVKAQGVTLDYGSGWPVISGLDADLRFEGAGMVVQARRGAILHAHYWRRAPRFPTSMRRYRR